MSTLVTFVLILFLWGWAGIALFAVIGSLCFFLMTELISDSSDPDGAGCLVAIFAMVCTLIAVPVLNLLQK
jgi:hypothetical protein